jgi:hypothetical protein
MSNIDDPTKHPNYDPKQEFPAGTIVVTYNKNTDRSRWHIIPEPGANLSVDYLGEEILSVYHPSDLPHLKDWEKVYEDVVEKRLNSKLKRNEKNYDGQKKILEDEITKYRTLIDQYNKKIEELQQKISALTSKNEEKTNSINVKRSRTSEDDNLESKDAADNATPPFKRVYYEPFLPNQRSPEHEKKSWWPFSSGGRKQKSRKTKSQKKNNKRKSNKRRTA